MFDVIISSPMFGFCLTILLSLALTACDEEPVKKVKKTTTDTSATTVVDTTASSGTTTQERQNVFTEEDPTTTSTHTTATTASTSAYTTISRTATRTTTATTQKKTTAVTATKKPTTTTTVATTTTTTTGAISIAQYESEVLRLVNIERAKQGLSALSQGNAASMQAADIRADEIKTSFSHTRPNNTTCFTALDEAGVKYHAAGENIAYGYQTPAAVVDGWMNSPGHRANILNETYTHLAVGYDNYHWVQLFYA